MDVRIETLPDGTLLGLWQIVETAAELRVRLQFPDMYADRIEGMREDSRRQREILAVRCLLREMTGEEQRILYDADGRPSAPQQIERVTETHEGQEVHTVFSHLSISHTDGWAAVLLSDHPVGIDIERLASRVERVTSKYLQPRELSLLGDNVELHLAWSAKESLYKVLGRDYYDLQRLTAVQSVRYDSSDGLSRRGTMAVAVEGQGVKNLRFETTADYVLVYFT